MRNLISKLYMRSHLKNRNIIVIFDSRILYRFFKILDLNPGSIFLPIAAQPTKEIEIIRNLRKYLIKKSFDRSILISNPIFQFNLFLLSYLIFALIRGEYQYIS